MTFLEKMSSTQFTTDINVKIVMYFFYLTIDFFSSIYKQKKKQTIIPNITKHFSLLTSLENNLIIPTDESKCM